MTKDLSPIHKDLERSKGKIVFKYPAIKHGFNRLYKASIADRVLTSKIKELNATLCNGCIGSHVHNAFLSGFSTNEIKETIGAAILIGGGPAMVYGCEAFNNMNKF